MKSRRVSAALHSKSGLAGARTYKFSLTKE